MNNRRRYTWLLACLWSATALMAQQPKEYKGRMNIVPLQFEHVGDSLLIHIDFNLQGVTVDSRRSISLIPVLIAPDKEVLLPEVSVKGRANYLTWQRQVALMSKAERQLYDQHPPYAIVKGYRTDGQQRIAYRQATLFEPWMKNARLDIQEDLCGCGNPPRSLAVSHLVSSVQLPKVIEPYYVTPHLAYVQPAVEAVKKREMVGEAFLDFVVSKVDICPQYMNNPRELKRITDLIEEVRNDSTTTVRSISVEGYASPEGTLAFNQTLSEGRATALVEYLSPKFDYPLSMYHVSFGGENWQGLLATVQASQMPHRQEVVEIIQNVPAEINYQTNSSRKKSLMMLRSGAPYRFMLKEYYPSLRKAICKISYEVKVFEVSEAKEVFKTRPQNLSLNEMYLVANTYEVGSQEFIDVFETAVRMYPQDETANLNAASAALARRDIASARRYLLHVHLQASTAEYNNAMGVCALLEGNDDEAEVYINKAVSAGLERAKHNLEELQKKRDNRAELNHNN